MELLTPQEVEQSIIELCNALEQQTELYAENSDAAVRAEADYKLVFARAVLASMSAPVKMTAQQREATADEETWNEFLAWKVEEARRQATRESLSSIRARLDAMRTLSATLRSQT